jgi:hypothetical protein
VTQSIAGLAAAMFSENQPKPAAGAVKTSRLGGLFKLWPAKNGG